MQNLLMALASFLGLPAGVLIATYTEAELELGHRYFTIIEHLINLAIPFLFFHSVGAALWVSIPAAGVFAGILWLTKKYLPAACPHLNYAAFAIMLFESKAAYPPIIACLVFFFGVAFAATQPYRKIKGMLQISLNNITFMIMSLLLML